MATPPEQPWSPHEKNYLLAEIIKAANPAPSVLFNTIRSLNIDPRWEDIPLPTGRSLNSSRYVFDDLRRTLSIQPISTAVAPQTPTPLSAPINLKRSFHYEGPFSAGAAGREIRPKPSMLGTVYSQPSASDPPPKRKRGRPTKAEAQAKAEAAAAAGNSDLRIVPAPTSAQAPAPAPTPTPRQIGPSPAPMPAPVRMTTATAAALPDAKSALPPTTRMPIAAMLTPTTRETKSASHSSSSSGKRRRVRSTKSEPEGSPMPRAGAGYKSPYAGVRMEPEDSPARAAVLRHRDDPEPRPRSGPPPDESAVEHPPPSQPRR